MSTNFYCVINRETIHLGKRAATAAGLGAGHDARCGYEFYLAMKRNKLSGLPDTIPITVEGYAPDIETMRDLKRLIDRAQWTHDGPDYPYNFR